MRPAGDAREKLGIALITGALAALFWIPAAERTGFVFPAPLDDVYIHFDYARALAQGSPFAWLSGQGYSSGETAPLYAWLLSLGWLVGFRGGALGWFAGAVAVVSVYSGLRAAARILRDLCPPARLVGLLLLASASVTPWLLFSGMEGALYFACMMHAVARYDELTRERVGPHPRSGQSRAARLSHLGWLSVAMFLLRPESLTLTWLFAVGVGRAQRGPHALPAIARVLLPTMFAFGLFALMNLAFTGYPEAAGAKLKLLSENPYLSNVDRARELALNLFHFGARALGQELSTFGRASSVLVGLGVVALLSRQTRSTASVCLLGALAFALLVSWNGAARYQNFRYYVPAISMLVLSALLGASRLSRPRGMWIPVAIAMGLYTFMAVPSVRAQSVYFARCAANIRWLQVEVGARVGSELPKEALVLVGDAGAIPYVSGRRAVDAIGLGGYHGVPFVLAATQGEAATVELIERLPLDLRPTHMALFPNWFPGLTQRFGHELFRVTVDDVAISGGPVKAVYVADWSALASPDEGREPRTPAVQDELDVCDVMSERAHDYVSPAPRGGWSTLDVRDDGVHRARFDGGRTIPKGEAESFVIHAEGRLTLVARWDVDGEDDSDAPAILVNGAVIAAPLAQKRPGYFTDVRIPLGDVRKDTRIIVQAGKATLRSYHYWLE